MREEERKRGGSEWGRGVCRRAAERGLEGGITGAAKNGFDGCMRSFVSSGGSNLLLPASFGEWQTMGSGVASSFHTGGLKAMPSPSSAPWPPLLMASRLGGE